MNLRTCTHTDITTFIHSTKVILFRTTPWQKKRLCCARHRHLRRVARSQIIVLQKIVCAKHLRDLVNFAAASAFFCRKKVTCFSISAFFGTRIFLTGSANPKTKSKNGGGESGLRVNFNYLSLIFITNVKAGILAYCC